MTADDLADAILAARLLRPYYGRALAALRPEWTDAVDTIAVTAGWRLLVRRDWFAGLALGERAAVIAEHEIEHLLRRHPARAAASPDSVAWNAAADAEINDDAGPDLAALIARTGGITPATLGAPPGLLAEQYLIYLRPDDRTWCGGCVEDDGQGGPTEAEAETIRAAVAEAVRAAATTDPGSVPAGVRMWADAELARRAPPVIPWQALLAGAVSRVVRAGRGDATTWARVARRYRHGAPLRPGRRAWRPTIGLAVDTSGSMSDAGQAIARVIDELRRAPADWIVAHGDVVASVSRGLPREWRGGGGTDLAPHLAALARRGCTATIVITDGHVPPVPPPGGPAVVVIVGDGPAPWPEIQTVRAGVGQ